MLATRADGIDRVSPGYGVCDRPLWTGLQANAPLPVMYLLCIPTPVPTFAAIWLVMSVARTPGIGVSKLPDSRHEVLEANERRTSSAARAPASSS
jgi:hypothetical protein